MAAGAHTMGACAHFTSAPLQKGMHERPCVCSCAAAESSSLNGISLVFFLHFISAAMAAGAAAAGRPCWELRGRRHAHRAPVNTIQSHCTQDRLRACRTRGARTSMQQPAASKIGTLAHMEQQRHMRSVDGMCGGAQCGRGQHASSIPRTLDQPLVLDLVLSSQLLHGQPYDLGIRALEQVDLAAAVAECGVRRHDAARPAGVCARLLVGHSTPDSPKLLWIVLHQERGGGVCRCCKRNDAV